jgi:cytochrome c peroxidase
MLRSLCYLLQFLSVVILTFVAGSRQTDAQQATSPTDELLQQSFQKFLATDLRVPMSQVGLPEVDEVSAEEYRQIELGRKLFFDPLLSRDGSISCATCHQPARAFSSPEIRPAGVNGRQDRRHPPAIINRRWGTAQFWDGRAASLEHQALQPIENENELASSIDDVLAKLKSDDEYTQQFQAAFDDGINRDNLATAIASFERILLSADSPIDRFVTASDSVDLTRSQRQGLWIYESKGGCWQCHSGHNYTDEKFHNTGVSWGAEPPDLGYFEVTGNAEHKGQYKTPTLRDVALTAPYMHDGSIATLSEVVEFYNRGGNENPNRDSRIKPLNLSDQEKEDLEAFLRALTGRHAWD